MTIGPRLRRPVLALCGDRTALSKRHPTSGSPEEWFADGNLARHGLRGLDFDFFVDWSAADLRVSADIWIKRLVDPGYRPWPLLDRDLLWRALADLETEERLRWIARVVSAWEMKLSFQVFPDPADWANAGAWIISLTLGSDGQVTAALARGVAPVAKEIEVLSGGPVRMGAKGLIYGTSSLECSLSHSATLWPGDVDKVIVDRDRPKCLLEFKKHTLAAEVSAHSFATYYPKPDGRKWNRLAALSNRLGGVPIISINYPTRPELTEAMVERVEGPPGGLRTTASAMVEVPAGGNPSELLNAVLGLLP